MQSKSLASIAYEIGNVVGDTSSSFLGKIKIFLNDRYDDVLMRTGATQWTIASFASLGDTDVPTLGLGRVIKKGAFADAYNDKRQFAKGGVFERKYGFELANYIISGDYQVVNISVARYDYHEE